MAKYVYAPYEHTQSDVSAEWLVNHRFNRDVNVQVFNEYGIPVLAHFETVEEIIGSKVYKNKVRITFKRKGVAYPIKGRAIIW